MPRPRHPIRALLLTCLLLAGAVLPAAAIDATLALAQLHRTRWTTRDGAPSDVNALAQTADGALWIASSTGLLRFDGVRFDRYRSTAGEEPLAEDLSALYAPPSGELWIGARLGGVHVLRAGHLTSYGSADGLPSNTVLAMVQDADGHRWVGTTNGLYELDGARWRRIGAERALPARYISALLVDARGTLWVSGLEGTFALARGARDFARRRDGGTGAGLLSSGPGGTAWLADKSLGLAALDGAGAAPLSGRDLGGDGPAIPIARFDRDGGLWAVVDGGLVRLPAAARLWSPQRAAALRELEHLRPLGAGAPLRIETVLEDREGDLWLGTADGLERLRGVKLRAALPASAPLPNAALAVAHDGAVWAAGETGDQIAFMPGPVLHPHRDGSPGVAAYAVDATDTHWIGGVDALVRDDGHAWTRIPTPSTGVVVQAMARERGGALWVSMVRGGLYRWSGERWLLHGGADGLPDGPAMCLVLAGDGRLWAGYTGDRVAVVDGGTARLLGAAQGLRVGAVLAIALRGERVWVGGTGGLALYRDGRFWSVTRPDGSDITGVSGIVQTRGGELWVNGAAGITRIAADELARFVADPSRHVRSETFDHEDGLEGLAPQLRPLPTAVEGGDGRLWFATSRDLYWVDPAHLPRNATPPSVRILALKAGERSWSPVDGLELPVRTSDFAFDYTAFSLAMPERVRFRYRLEGLDATWQDAGTRRQAFYTNIPPGRYRFRVIAVNEDGVWNETGDAFAFEVPPSFWQTWWFYGLCALAAAALLWSLYTLRLRQLAARMAGELDARLQERERIARELHDTLLQSTQGLILNFQGVALQLPTDSPVRQRMETTLDRADSILAEARGRVLDLRSAGLPGQALPEAIAEAAAELATGDAPSFRVLVEGLPRELCDAVQVESTRIAREALANAFAHAQAREIEAHVVYGPLSLRVRVRDDGIGIAADVLASGARPGHWGLVGMRERAERFGARVELWSRAGAGTEVELSVPAAVAYRRAPGGRWWQRLAARAGLRARYDAAHADE